jgi:hypothetical protein
VDEAARQGDEKEANELREHMDRVESMAQQSGGDSDAPLQQQQAADRPPSRARRSEMSTRLKPDEKLTSLDERRDHVRWEMSAAWPNPSGRFLPEVNESLPEQRNVLPPEPVFQRQAD